MGMIKRLTLLGDKPADVKQAAHAVGLDTKLPYRRYTRYYFKPLRNWVAVEHPGQIFDIWEQMVRDGKAVRERKPLYYLYHLTRKGLDWLGDELSIYIYDEEEDHDTE